MELEEKLKQFADLVFDEVESEKEDILSKVESEYKDSITEFEISTSQKYSKRLKNETEKASRLMQKEIIEAQADLKHELIKKRTEQIEIIFENVNKKLHEFYESPEYIRGMIGLINSNIRMGSETIVYLVKRDMAYKQIIEKETGVTVKLSAEDFAGGLKMTLSDTQTADYSIKSRFEEEKEKFNKIRIF